MTRDKMMIRFLGKDGVPVGGRVRHVSSRKRGGEVTASVIDIVSKRFPVGAQLLIHQQADRLIITQVEVAEEVTYGRGRGVYRPVRSVTVWGFADESHVLSFKAQLVQRLIKEKHTVLDLFAGCGGQTLAFTGAGFKVLEAVDWDRWCESIYKLNFPDVPFQRINMRAYRPRLNRPLIGLVATPPCDDFSRANHMCGQQKGLQGKQSGVMLETLRLVDESEPREFVFFENVAGLPTANGGRDLALLQDEMGRRGFSYYSGTVMPALGWVPQYRLRWYGVFTREALSFKFPTRRDDEKLRLGDFLEPAGTVPRGAPRDGGYDWTEHQVGWFHQIETRARAKGSNFKAVFSTYDSTRVNTLVQNSHRRNSDSQIIVEPDGRYRRLTQREMARVMGFPDSFRLGALSWTRATELFGNSVVVPLLREMASHIREAIIERVAMRRARKEAARPSIQLALV